MNPSLKWRSILGLNPKVVSVDIYQSSEYIYIEQRSEFPKNYILELDLHK